MADCCTMQDEQILADHRKQALLNCRVKLVKNVSVAEVMNDLRQEGAITEYQQMEIRNYNTNTFVQAERLLDILARRSNKAFDDFVKALENSGQKHLAAQLKDEEAKLAHTMYNASMKP